MTCIIFPPFSVSCFGSHRYGRCVFNGRGEGRLWTTSKSGIASRKKNSLISLVYSVLPLISIHTTSQIQCVPKNKKNIYYMYNIYTHTHTYDVVISLLHTRYFRTKRTFYKLNLFRQLRSFLRSRADSPQRWNDAIGPTILLTCISCRNCDFYMLCRMNVPASRLINMLTSKPSDGS